MSAPASAAISLAGKVALITGGTKGIGRATALTMVRQGAKVVVNYGRDTSAAQSLVSEAGGETHAAAIQADAGDVGELDKLVSATVARFGKIDILVPNAATLLMKTVATTTEDDFDRSFGLNVKGPYFLVQKALPHMAPGSRIVFLSSTQNHASTVTAPYTLYCAPKGAVEHMTRVMAKDLAARGIAVNCVAPGATATELFFEGKSEQLVQTIASFNPYKRLGEPQEIADAIVYLCGPAASWVGGQVLRVNGGQV